MGLPKLVDGQYGNRGLVVPKVWSVMDEAVGENPTYPNGISSR